MRDVAALVGALGVVLVLVPRQRLVLLSGIPLVAAAAAVLAVSLVPREDLEQSIRSVPQLAAVLLGAVVVLAVAIVLLRRPGLVPVLILAAAPFRVPVTLGEQEAFLLIPLYAVLAAASLALMVRALREPGLPRVPLVLGIPVAAYVGLASLSILWTQDADAAALELVFFLLPFSLLVATIARSPLQPWLPKALAVTLLALCAVFAAVGLWQAYSRELFFAPTLEVANAYTTFFRVTSLFRDPSLYGRHLVLAIALVLILLLRGKLAALYAVPLLLFLWAGLYPSYSQSSMVALFVVVAGIGLVVGDRLTRVGVLLGAAVILVAGGLFMAVRASDSPLEELTRGRSTLVSDTTEVFLRDPIVGVGIGAQPRAAAQQPERRASRARAASHTTPLTVAAELGMVGLAAYVGLLAAALVLLRAAWRRAPELGLGLAAAFTTILVQSLVYSGFFEDPLMWGALALAAAYAAPALATEPSLGRRLRAWRPSRVQTAVTVAVVLLLLGLVAAFAVQRREPSAGALVTSTADITIRTEETVSVEQPPSRPTPPEPVFRQEGPCWKIFGGGPMRQLSRPHIRLGRPAEPVWARGLRDLMEYPPTYCNGRLYVNLERGKTVALDSETGRVLWTRRASGAMASSPAIAGHRLVVSSHGGTVTALRRSNGRLLWELRTDSPVESSPVVVDRDVYVGAADGRLYSIALRTGRVRWIYDTRGRISSSPSVVGARVCITTYAGAVMCLSRRDGHRIWSRYVRRDSFRYESFYASASSDGRRLFTVARSGRVVALAVADGSQVWSAHLHALTYGTPSVARGIVIVADLAGSIRAFRSRDGRQLWQQHVRGRVLGPTLVVGGLVFFSTLEGKTYAAQTRTGRIVWSFNAGKYAPGIATKRRYYFSFNGLLVAFSGETGPPK